MYEFSVSLHKESAEPLFLQLYMSIKMEITSGKLARNEQLPSKRRLATSLGCSLNTVQAAYNQLVDEGYITSRPKSGYYVAALDGIVTLDKAQQVSAEHKAQAMPYAYDFSYQGVDDECFPFALWRRLAREAVADGDRELLRTGDAQGHPTLRAGIARYLRHSRHVMCTPEQIIISSGTEFLLQLLVQLFGETTVYAIENPGYEKLGMIFNASRANWTAVPLDAYGIQPEALSASGAGIVCITPSHQFPTGRIMPISRRIQLLNWAYEQPERYIIEDDYDSEFRYAGKPIPSLQGLDGQGRVIYIGSFSKSISPALRISYMVLPEALLQRYRERLNFYICPVPTAEQKTLQLFIDEGYFERHLNRMRNLYRQKRECLVKEINEQLPGAEVEGDSAGLHFTLRVNNGMSEQALIQSAGNHRVKVYGLSRYYSILPPGQSDGTVLLGFATLKINGMAEAVSLLRRAWLSAGPE